MNDSPTGQAPQASALDSKLETRISSKPYFANKLKQTKTNKNKQKQTKTNKNKQKQTKNFENIRV